MKIQRIVTLCFSATGNTEKTVKTIGEELSAQLGVPVERVAFTRPAERAEDKTFGPQDLVVVGVPVFAGKIPNKLLPDFQTKLHGNGALAVAAVTFGNRSYDNALAELCATLEWNGFHTFAGGAFVGQHSMAVKLAVGRPNEADIEQTRAFADRIAERVEKLTAAPVPVQVPGDADAPYFIPRGQDGQPAKFLKAKPKTDLDKCVKCGLCAKNCPLGSIDPMDVSNVPGVCIKCHACVHNCPKQAKFFDDPVLIDHRTMVENTFVAPKENEMFLSY